MHLTRICAGIAAAGLFTMGSAGVAFADQIVNTIDSSVDNALESTTISAGDSTIVYFYVKPEQNVPTGDVNGCNATGSDPASVTLSVPPNVTASATTVSIAGCGDTPTTRVPVTFSSTIAGSYTISVSGVSGGRAGSLWATAPASFTLVVNAVTPPDTTAPDTFLISFPTTLTTLSSATFSFTGSDNQTAAADLAFECRLDDGPFLACTSPTTYSGLADGLHTFQVRAIDAAGNVDPTPASSSWTVDTVAPVITDLGPTTGPDGANGWYVSAVSNQFFAADATSGLPPSFVNPWVVSSGTAEGSAVTVASGTVSDNAGNVAPSIDSAAFAIDLTDPTGLAFVGGPADGGEYYFGQVPAAPTCTAEDAVSGLASCSVTGYSSAVGTHVLTATATDNAGRTATATRSYTVLAWTLSGFYSPVDMNGVLNTVKGGSTVPLKFRVFAGTTELTDPAVVDSFKAIRINCDFLLPEDAIEQLATTGGTSLRYDASGAQFIQNWQTPKSPGTCYQAVMTTDDGSTLVANFKLK